MLLATAVAAAPRRWAVVIGCNAYEHAKPLKGCVVDAERLTKALVAGGYRVWLMTDKALDHAGRRHADLYYPDRATIIQQVPQFLPPGSLGPEDTVLFAFSGHGVRNEADGNDYLVPLSARSAAPSDLIGVPWVYERLRQTGAGSIVLITDACRWLGTGLTDRSDFGVATAHQLKAIPPGQQYVFLRSCSEGQYSYEDGANGGFFATALVEALDRCVDKTVCAGDAYRYVKERVAELARKAGKEQTPVYERKGDDPDAVVLAPQLTGVVVVLAVPSDLPAYLARWRDKMPSMMEYRRSRKDQMLQVHIPGGEFLIGAGGNESWGEGPPKLVTVRGFWMDVHCVTAQQYKAYCDATDARVPPAPTDAGPLHAVVNVSWDDAMAYAKWAGRFLPTEAQWEYAARGGLAGKKYAWGDEWQPSQANCRGDGPPVRTPVASFPPNGLGLFDMAGNVWQWCRDYYHQDWFRLMPARDPENTVETRVRSGRGGSYGSGPAREYLRVAQRWWSPPNRRDGDIGFRCVEPE
jgi:formylglycine-generating enzyme required for sulfatase activity